MKTNIGHAESAAGIAGLIKAVLALQHGRIPPSLHFNKLNPSYRLGRRGDPSDGQGIEVESREGRRVAGVSSFGFSGTNAHVIVSDLPDENSVPQMPANARAESPLHLLPLSARTEQALLALAREYEQVFTREPDLNLADVAYTAGAGRSHFDHRLAVRGIQPRRSEGAACAFQRGEKGRAHSAADAPKQRARPALCSCLPAKDRNTPAWVSSCMRRNPFSAVNSNAVLKFSRPHLEKPLLEVLFGSAGAAKNSSPLLDETQYTQPALFALEYALAALWRSWGIEPAAVLGHSVGEYVAACVAGVFSLEDALRLIAARARLMQAMPRNGAMAAVFAGEDRVARPLRLTPIPFP